MPSPDQPAWLESLNAIRADVAEIDTRIQNLSSHTAEDERRRLKLGRLSLHLQRKLTALKNAVHDALKAELAAGTLRGREQIAARDARDALDAADDAIEAEAGGLTLAECDVPEAIFGRTTDRGMIE